MTSPGSGSDQTRNANVVLTADTTQYQQSVQSSAQQTNMLSAALDALSAKLDGLAARAGKRLAIFSAADFAGLGAATAMSASFEKQLSTLQATASVTGASFGQIKSGIEGTFKALPVAREQVVQLTTALTQLGQTAPDQLTKLTQTFLKLGAATGEGPTDLAAGLTQLSQLMGTNSADTINRYANSLLVVSKNAGVASTGVLNFAQAIAPLGRQAGLTEAQILGISTAFTKAGADGMPAFNALNSLMSDITQELQTGSPEIQKFAQLIGKSADQFKKMDGASRIVDIFNAIGKAGPKGVQILNQLGLEGIRTQSAIAAVTQTGELQKFMGMAVGSSNSTQALDKASSAAMGGLSDQLARLRNQFTQLGTDLGSTLLPPLEKMTQYFADFVGGAVKLVHIFDPLISTIGTLAGAFGGLGAAALVSFGIISKLATLRLLATGSPLKAFGQGMAVGRNPATVNASSILASNGDLRWYNRPFYAAGRGLGMAMGQPDPMAPQSTVANARNFLVSSPARGLRWLADTERSWLQASTLPAEDRLGTVTAEQSVLNARKRGFTPPSVVLGQGTTKLDALRARMQAWLQGGTAGAPPGMPVPPVAPTGPHSPAQAKQYADDLKKYNDAVKAATIATAASTKAKTSETAADADVAAEGKAQVGMFTALGAETKNLLVAFAKLGATTIGTGFSLAGKTVGYAGKQLWQALGPIGTALIALPMLDSLKNSMQKKQSDATDFSSLVNPIQQMNDTLGIANQNLATFASNLATANSNSTSLADSQKPVTWATAAHVSVNDPQAAKGVTPNAQMLALAQHPNDVRSLRAYVQSLDLYDPKQLQLAKQQALAAGFAPGTINQAFQGISQANSAGGGYIPNFTHLLNTAFNSNDKGFLGTNPDRGGSSLLSTVLSAYGTAYQVNRLKSGGKYAAAQSVMGVVNTIRQYLSTGSHGNPNTQIRQLAAGLNTEYGGGVDTWVKQIQNNLYTKTMPTGLSGGVHGNLQPLLTYSGNNQGIMNMLGTNKLTRDMLSFLPSTDYAQLRAVMPKMAQQAQSDYQRNFSGTPLGAMAYNSKLIRSVTGTNDQTQNTPLIAQAEAQLMHFTSKLAGGAGMASYALEQLANKMANGVDPAMQALATDAMNLRQSAFMGTVFPTMSMGHQTAYLQQQTALAYQEWQKTGQGESNYQSLNSALMSQQQANMNYAKQMFTTVRDYNVQMVRSYQDYHKQTYRSERDFHIQMQRSEAQYQRTRYRQTRDFNIQLEQQNMQAAQTIYSPYQRVFSQQTASAGQTLYNLQDQNQRILQQRKELVKLTQLGMSQQTIDVLDLSNPQNAQELNSLYNELANDPGLIKALNKQAAERVKATKALTQSSFSYSFRQETAQFHRGFLDMAHDFHIQQTYAKQDEQRGLNDMAYDFNQMLQRSADDMKRSLTQVTGSFAKLMKETFKELGQSINQYAPQYARVIQKNLNSLYAPSLGGPGGGGGGGGANAGGSMGPLGSISNPITRPGVEGLNSRGVYGHYGKGGKFFKDKPLGPEGISTAQHIAPPGSNKVVPKNAEQRYAFDQFKWYGWAANRDNYESLVEMWNQESGWRTNARNPSGAYGIAQALGHGVAGAGAVTNTDQGRMWVDEYPSKAANSGDYRAQIDWGLNYIKQRYGSPSNAWRNKYWQQGGWYDHGGILKPGVTQTINATGRDEYILTPQQLKAFHTQGLGKQCTNIYSSNIHNSTNFNGEITVQAQDPNAMADALKKKARLQALTNPNSRGPRR